MRGQAKVSDELTRAYAELGIKESLFIRIRRLFFSRLKVMAYSILGEEASSKLFYNIKSFIGSRVH